ADPETGPGAEARDDNSKTVTSETLTMAMASEFGTDVLDCAMPDDTRAVRDADARRPRSALAGWVVAAVFALLATAEAAWIGRVELARAAAPPPVPIVLDSLQQGDTVIVDGREVGVTPLTLTL